MNQAISVVLPQSDKLTCQFLTKERGEIERASIAGTTEWKNTLDTTSVAKQKTDQMRAYVVHSVI